VWGWEKPWKDRGTSGSHGQQQQQQQPADIPPPPCVHHARSHGWAGEGAREAVQGPAGSGRSLRAAAVASFVAAAVAEIYLCDVCSGQEILSQGLGHGQGQGQGQGWQRRATELGAELAVGVSAAAAASARGVVAPAALPRVDELCPGGGGVCAGPSATASCGGALPRWAAVVRAATRY
jgi:hypothetical protein